MIRRLCKSLVHGMANVISPSARGLPEHQEQLFILTWHSFSARWRPGLVHALPIALFERQLDWITQHFTVAPLSEAWSVTRKGANSTGRPLLAITMDDGYANNYTLAFPALRARELPATMFVATDFIDTGRAPWPVRIRYILQNTKVRAIEAPISLELRNQKDRDMAAAKLKQQIAPLVPSKREEMLANIARQCGVTDWETAIPPMKWKQLREMSEHGITIGAHTHSHSILPEMPADIAMRDIAESRKRIEAELDLPCRMFAYPDGAYDRNVRHQVKSAGFELCVTQDPGLSDENADRLALPRIDIPHHDPFQTFVRRVTQR